MPVVRLVSSALHVGREVLVASVAFKRKQVKIQSEGADVEALVLNVLSLAAGAEGVVAGQGLQLGVLCRQKKSE